jgi:hypothetical protein
MRSLSSDNYYRGLSLPQKRGEKRRVDVGWRKNQLERRLHTLPHKESDFLSADIERV